MKHKGVTLVAIIIALIFTICVSYLTYSFAFEYKKKSQTNANLNQYSSIATINENYLLASCLDDSLLTKININTGAYTSLLLYTDISTSNTLTVPDSCCSLSIFENFAFIGFPELLNSNITDIAIKIKIKNKDDINGPILDTSSEITFFIFPIPSMDTGGIRQIGCEAIYLINDETDYRLICSYEYRNASKSFIAFASVINSSFNGFELYGKETKLFSSNGVSGIRIYKLDSFHLRSVMRKMVYDLYLEYDNDNNMVKLVAKKANSNLLAYSASKDLFDYNNNFIVSVE